MNNKGLIAAIVIVVGIGAYVMFANNKTDDKALNNDTNQNQNTNTNQNPGSTDEVKSGEVTIEVLASGFSPAQVTVKKGTKVTFVNKDTKSIWPASAPHPTHTDYSAFDPKEGVAVGGSWSFTFDQVGGWSFHDHLFPSHFGKVTVVE